MMDEPTKTQPPLPQSFISVLIIARPGRFRDGLSALVSAIPYVDRIYHEPGGAAVLKRVLRYRPALVIWDMDVHGQEINTLLPALRDQIPDTVSLVLVEDVSQEKLLKRAGADAVLIKGIHADKLLTTIEALLFSKTVR